MAKRVLGKNEKCKFCGGDLKFSPKFSCLYCENCEKQFPIIKKIDFQKHCMNTTLANDEKYSSWRSESKLFKCSNCGSSIILNSLEYSTCCPYCGSAFVAEKGEIPGIAPDSIIPFAFDENEAAENFTQGIKKKWFLPNAFKKKLPQKDIKGIYIPVFSFDSDTVSTYNGILEDRETETMNGKTYTKTNTQHIHGTTKLEYKDIDIETSSQINQLQLTEILPFNQQERCSFDEDYIRGYTVEHYDSALNQCFINARNVIDNSIRSKILSQYSYDSVVSLDISTSYSNEKYLYCIYPLYRFEYEYSKKKYITYMNGQTGKVGGGVPRSKVKISFFVISIALIFIGIIALSLLFSLGYLK